MRSLAYVVLVSCEDIRAKLLFNDWPAIDIRKDRGVMRENKVNAMVLQGENVLELSLRRSKTGKNPRCEMTLVVAPHGPEEVDPVLLYEWEPALAPLAEDPDEAVVVLEHRFTVDEAFGRWGWESARAFMPTDEPDVADAMMTLHQAYARRDVDQVTELVRLRLEEVARSLELDSGKMVDVGRMDMQIIADATSFAIEPLAREELTFHSSARGRLVEVRRKDGEMPIKGIADGVPFGFQVTFSAVGGSWKVVR